MVGRLTTKPKWAIDLGMMAGRDQGLHYWAKLPNGAYIFVEAFDNSALPTDDDRDLFVLFVDADGCQENLNGASTSKAEAIPKAVEERSKPGWKAPNWPSN